MNIYAAPADLPVAYRTDPNAPALIERASELVTEAIRSSVFPVGSDGMPGDPEDLAATKAAVVRQVSTWLSTGVNPVTGLASLKPQAASKSSNGSSISYQVDPAVTAYMRALAAGDRLIDWAEAPLRARGLTEVVLVGGAVRRLYNPVPSPDTHIDGGEG